MRTALLVDDEPAASVHLTELLADSPRIKMIGTVESVEEARTFIAQPLPDVVFLDVEMPGGSGLELFESLPDSVQVCFVTAYQTYVLEAFVDGVVHHLLKPGRSNSARQGGGPASAGGECRRAGPSHGGRQRCGRRGSSVRVREGEARGKLRL